MQTFAWPIVLILFALAGFALAQSAASQPARPDPAVFVHFYTQHFGDGANHTVPFNGGDDPDLVPADYDQWWRQELQYVVDARIDVINLMCGEVVPGVPHYRRFARMLDVMAERTEAGLANPQVVMFYDGFGYNAFRDVDLDSDEGTDEFYRWLKRFFDLFIHEHDAEDVLYQFDGGFPVWVYHPEPRGGMRAGNRLVPEIKRRFARDFPGREVYLVFSELYRDGHYGNNALELTNADNYFAYGAALTGIQCPAAGEDFGVISIGPGFDERQRRFREEGWGERVRDRQDGAVLRREFARASAIADRAPWLILETWNFYTEGTAIGVTEHYGDQYVRICAERIPQFKAAAREAARRPADAAAGDGVNTVVAVDPPTPLPGPEYFLRDWLVLGPIPLEPATDEAGAEAVTAPVVDREAALQPTAGDEQAGLTWRPYRNPWPVTPETIDLAAMLGEHDYATALLAARIDSDRARTVNLLLGSDDFVRVYWNGRAVHDFAAEPRGAVEDGDRVANLRLREGENWLILKVVNLRGGWGAIARLVDAEDRPIRLQP